LNLAHPPKRTADDRAEIVRRGIPNDRPRCSQAIDGERQRFAKPRGVIGVVENVVAENQQFNFVRCRESAPGVGVGLLLDLHVGFLDQFAHALGFGID
jgi:hypothetical protein